MPRQRLALSCCVRVFFFVCVCCAGLVLHGGQASAFCRTTTSRAPAGYNPAVSGCWTGGTPLSWHIGRVPYAVASAASRQVSLAEATRVAELAFGAWNGTVCDGQPLSIGAYDDGPIAVPAGAEGDALAAWAQCSNSGNCNPAAYDAIIFDDESWPYNDTANTLALTTVSFGVDDGQIFEAYTEVNSAEHELTTAEPPAAGSKAFDLQAILTHEAGHFLGLAHATETTSIMYAFYQPGAIEPTPDDVQGICTAYPPGESPGSASTAGGTSNAGGMSNLGKCACDAAGARAHPGAALATLSFAALACLRRRRRRSRRRGWR